MNAGFVLVDVSAGLVPGGGIGRYVRDLMHALRTLPDAPPARFLVTRSRQEAAREQLRPEEMVHVPFTWRQLALGWMVGTTVGLPFDALYQRPALVHSPLGYGPTFRRARLLNISTTSPASSTRSGTLGAPARCSAWPHRAPRVPPTS